MHSQEDIDNQRKLLEINRRNLAHYLSQQTSLGAAYTPPSIVNGIRDSRDSIRRIKGILRDWGEAVEDHPDDEPADESALAAGSTGTRQASGSGITVNIHGGTFQGNIPIGSPIGGDLHQGAGGTTVGTTFNQPNWNVQGDVYNIARDLNISSTPDHAELLAALRRLQAELDKAQDLPPDEADDLKSNLDSAIKAVDRPQPNKDRTVEKLSTMQKILDGLKGNIGSALALGHLIGQVLQAAQGLRL